MFVPTASVGIGTVAVVLYSPVALEFEDLVVVTDPAIHGEVLEAILALAEEGD